MKKPGRATTMPCRTLRSVADVSVTDTLAVVPRAEMGRKCATASTTQLGMDAMREVQAFPLRQALG